jgi:hypothetical protein
VLTINWFGSPHISALVHSALDGKVAVSPHRGRHYRSQILTPVVPPRPQHREIRDNLPIRCEVSSAVQNHRNLLAVVICSPGGKQMVADSVESDRRGE